MAYTNAWSNIVPAGSDALNTADDQIRRLRLDVQERMDDVVADWTADPVVPGSDVGDLTGTPDCAKVYANANPTVLTGVAKTIPFVAESFDPGGFHSNSVNPTRLTITTAAYYYINAQIEMASPGVGAEEGAIEIKKNGVAVATCFTYHPGGVQVIGFQVSTIDLAAATDYYEVVLEQASGNTWTVQTDVDESYFEIFRLPGTV